MWDRIWRKTCVRKTYILAKPHWNGSCWQGWEEGALEATCHVSLTWNLAKVLTPPCPRKQPSLRDNTGTAGQPLALAQLIQVCPPPSVLLKPWNKWWYHPSSQMKEPRLKEGFVKSPCLGNVTLIKEEVVRLRLPISANQNWSPYVPRGYEIKRLRTTSLGFSQSNHFLSSLLHFSTWVFPYSYRQNTPLTTSGFMLPNGKWFCSVNAY